MLLSHFYMLTANSVLSFRDFKLILTNFSLKSDGPYIFWSFELSYVLFQRKWDSPYWGMTSSYLQCFQRCVRFCCSVSSCSGVLLLCACGIPTQPLALVTGRSLLPAPLIPRARLAWGRGLKQTFSGGVEKTEGNSMTKQESTSDAKSDATSMAASGMEPFFSPCPS